MLRFALPKGRLEKDTLKLLEKIGIKAVEPKKRELIYWDTTRQYSFLSVRNVDVPTYVEYGIADIGVVGKDILLEQERDVYEPVDLGFGKCHLMVATLEKDANKPYPLNLRVATKYPNIARKFFLKKGISCDVIKLYGSVELAPLVGLASHIVDIVTTGNTLRANGLREIEFITESTARLIVNKASYKIKFQEIKEIIDKIRKEL